MKKLGMPLFVVGVIIAACFASDPVRSAPGEKLGASARVSTWAGRSGLPFGVGLVLVVVGGLLARSGTKREVETEDGSTTDPRFLIEQIKDKLYALPTEATETHRVALTEVLDGILEEDVPAFLEHRQALIDKHGLGPFAEMIGQFAQAERNAARAWSALTDEAWAEVAPSIERARVGIDNALVAYDKPR